MWQRLVVLLFLLSSVVLAHAAPTTPTADFTDNGDGTVTHKTTGLTWKRCAEGQTWTGSNCTGTAATYTYDQAAALTSSFAGKSDWRLPTIAELGTIVERSSVNPAINTTVFPGTPASVFWSGSADARSSGNSWFIHYYNGDGHGAPKRDTYHVRLVRGGQMFDPWVSSQYTPDADFSDNGDGSVTHKKTTLTWKRCSEGQTWSGSTCTGTAATYSWDQATALTSGYAGKSDWRLPTLNELLTLVEWSTVSPAINPRIFPATPTINYFWSASAYAVSSGGAWGIYFEDGTHSPFDRTAIGRVRLVRGGQSVGASSTATGLTGLSLSCPATVAAGATASCSASAAYSDGSSKAVSPITWSSTNTGALSVSGGALSAGRPGYDVPVTISASYVEGGVTKSATAPVTVKDTPITLTRLDIICTSQLAAGGSGACTATGTYSDGSSKAATPTWSSSDSATISVSTDGKLSAGQPASDSSVTISASVTENGVSKAAATTVAVKAAGAATATGVCSGISKNLSAITIPGDATKHLGDGLEVSYCLKNFNSATKFDIYVAVQLPDRNMMFLQAAGFFQTPTFTGEVAPYLANTLIPDRSGKVLSIQVLPMTLPTGTYTFYAIPVLAGGSVMDGFQWIGNLAKQDVTIAK